MHPALLPQIWLTIWRAARFAALWWAVLKGISDGLSRGKRPEEMEKLVSDSILPGCSLVTAGKFGNGTMFGVWTFFL
jgi:hypothetical protein